MEYLRSETSAETRMPPVMGKSRASETASDCDSNYLTRLRFLTSDEKTVQKIGRGGGIRTHDLFVPNEAR